MTDQDHGVAPVIVGLPAEIDMANAEGVRDLLVGAALPGATVVIADLTNTKFCDSSGFRELVEARKRLAATGMELRLALPPGNVRRVMQVIGLDQVVTPYPSVRAAAAGDAG